MAAWRIGWDLNPRAVHRPAVFGTAAISRTLPPIHCADLHLDCRIATLLPIGFGALRRVAHPIADVVALVEPPVVVATVVVSVPRGLLGEPLVLPPTMPRFSEERLAIASAHGTPCRVVSVFLILRSKISNS